MVVSPTGAKVDSDDDLDEFDDVLAEFNDSRSTKDPGSSGRLRTNTTVHTRPTLPSVGTGSGNSSGKVEPNDDELSEAFARELAKGMETLMHELCEGEDTLPILGELLSDTSPGQSAKGAQASGSRTDPSATEPKGDDFQERLKHAMDKLKESESNLQADPSPKLESGEPESLEALLESFKTIGDDGEDDEALAGFLENIMGQLLSREVLYEPLKTLSDKFPEYLESPPSPLDAADRQRYEKQQICVKKILAIFDTSGYSDENAESHKAIVELMSEIQSYGSPPPELMGPLPPGVPIGADGLPDLNEGCAIA